MTLFLYLLHQPCFHPCLHFPSLVYFIDLVPFPSPPCSISKCLLVTIYTPSCLVSYKYPSTSPCSFSLKSTKSLLCKGSTLDLCCCTQLVSHALRVVPCLGQPLPFRPRPLDLEFIQTLTQRRPGLDSYCFNRLLMYHFALNH